MPKKQSRESGGGYDPAKDVIVETCWKAQINDKTEVRLVVRRYDGGSAKLAVEEVFVRRNGEPGSKGLPRVAAKVAALPGFAEAYCAAAAKYADEGAFTV